MKNTDIHSSFVFSSFKRIEYLFVLALFLTASVLTSTAPLYALSQEQQNIFNLGITAFDTDIEGGCSPLGGGGSVTLDGTLPEETIKKMESEGIMQKAEAMKSIYMYGAQQTNIPWQMLAALHYREGNMQPGTSIFNGQKLGNYRNVDGIMLSSDPNVDAVNAAKHFISNAKTVYNVDVVTTRTAEAIGQAYLAYNRGAMYKNWGTPWTESPYVMNMFDASHMNMKWTDADSYVRPGGQRLNGLTGKTETRPGAMAVLKYLSDTPNANGGEPAPAASGGCGYYDGSTVVGDLAFPLVMQKAQVDKYNPSLFKDGTTGRAGHPYIAYDILSPERTKVAAFMGGEVLKVDGGNACGPRTTITIWNEQNKMTITYIHLIYTTYIKAGDTVSVGQVIAEVGPGDPYGCGTTHLHIDANSTKGRPPCARPENGGCTSENASKFIDIGPQLYKTYEAIGAPQQQEVSDL